MYFFYKLNSFIKKKILFKTNRDVYSALINLYNFFFHNKITIKFISKDNIYKATNIKNKRSRFFCSEGYGIYAYLQTLEARGHQLGNDYFLDLINFNKNDVIIDCGANVGDLLLWFENKKLDINYVAFEPSPNEFKCLKRNIGNHTSYNLGLWKEDKKIDFYVSQDNADSSFIKPKKYSRIVQIPAVKLSSYINSNIKLLKLEAEGAEPEILEGVIAKLQNIEYISADLGPERGEEEKSTLVDVTNFLLKNNFSLIAISHIRITALFKNNKY